jgi:hypothetical protein
MKFKSKEKAQGAIEYLLVLGAAIIVVAIVILLMTGLVSDPPNNREAVFDAQKQLQYETIGYKLSADPGEIETFELDILPEDPKVTSVFGTTPVVKITINGSEVYDPDVGSWEDAEQELAPGDIIVIENNSSEEFDVSIKGDYATTPPFEADVDVIELRGGYTFGQEIMDRQLYIVLENKTDEEITLEEITIDSVSFTPFDCKDGGWQEGPNGNFSLIEIIAGEWGQDCNPAGPVTISPGNQTTLYIDHSSHLYPFIGEDVTDPSQITTQSHAVTIDYENSSGLMTQIFPQNISMEWEEILDAFYTY